MSGPHPIPEMRCLVCSEILNHASDTNDSTAPTPGDWTICLYCKNVMVFEANLTLRALTAEEEKEAESDPGVREAKDFADFYAKATGKAVRH